MGEWCSGTKASVVLCSSLALGFIVSGLVPDKGQQLITEPRWVTLKFSFPRRLLMRLISKAWVMLTVRLKAFPARWLSAERRCILPSWGSRWGGGDPGWHLQKGTARSQFVLHVALDLLTAALNSMVFLDLLLSLVLVSLVCSSHYHLISPH